MSTPHLKPPRIQLPDPRSLPVVESKPPDADGWAAPVLQRPHSSVDQVIEGKLWRQHGGQALCVTAMNGRHLGEKIRGCWFDGTHAKGLKWLLRDYGTQGDIEECAFVNVDQEHGRYTQLAAGRSSLRDVLFRNIGSQAYQQRVYQQPESSYVDWSAHKILVMERIVALECATHTGKRPAFVISPKSGGPNAEFYGTDLFIQTVRGPTFQHGTQSYRSYGGLCFELWRSVSIENLQLELDLPRNDGVQFFDYGAPFERTLPDGSKALGARRAPRSIELRGGELWGCDISIRPQWHDQVLIAGFKGDGRIKLHHWHNGAWRLQASVPVGQGYVQS